MQIKRTSIISGVTRTREIDISEEQLNAWKGGMLIQNAAPHLSDNDREFIISGITEDEWNEVFGKGENE